MITDIFKTKQGSIIFSIILGLGIAAPFRRVCKDNACIVIQGPDPNELRNYYYKMDGNCYKYKHVMSECNA